MARTRIGIALAAFVLLFILPEVIHAQPTELIPPTCSSTTNPGPPKQFDITLQDAGSGMESVLVTESSNADTVVPPFTVGTAAPIAVTSTKIDQTQPMRISITSRDVSGNERTCVFSDGPGATCSSSTTNGFPRQMTMTVQNETDGIIFVTVSQSTNADTVVPAFPSGTTSPIVITSNQIDPNAPMSVTLVITDTNGRDTTCAFNAAAAIPRGTTCSATSASGSPRQIQITVRNAFAGVSAIDSSQSTNAIVDVPPFSSPTTSPIVVTATQNDPAAAMFISLLVTDANGRETTCTFAVEVTPPTCTPARIEGPPRQFESTVQDTGSGLASIVVTESTNADSIVPPFTVGTTAPVVVTSTKIDPSQVMRITIVSTDVDGNQTTCVMTDAEVVSPACASVRVEGPPRRFDTTVQDPGSGIASIVVTESLNADTVVPAFAVGTTAPVLITSTKIDQTQALRVTVVTTDLAGNQTTCVMTDAEAILPTCVTTRSVGPPIQFQSTVQDSGAGISTITITESTNADVVVPAFTVGTTAPVMIDTTKIDQTLRMRVVIVVRDGAGNENSCVITDGETILPACSAALLAGPPRQSQFTVQDAHSGIATIVVTESTNATTPVPPFAPGTTSPVVVTGTKIDPATPMRIVVVTTDVDGNETSCVSTDAESVLPVCSSTVVAGPARRLEFTVQDAGSGIASITVTRSINATTVVAPFAIGTTSSVLVTSTVVDRLRPMDVEIRTRDVSGNETVCGRAESGVTDIPAMSPQALMLTALALGALAFLTIRAKGGV